MVFCRVAFHEIVLEPSFLWLPRAASEVGLFFILQSYFYNDDAFNFTFGQTKAALGSYKEAQEVRILNLLNYYYDLVHITLRSFWGKMIKTKH